MKKLICSRVLVVFILLLKIRQNHGHFLEENHIYQDESVVAPIYNGSSITELLSLCRTGNNAHDSKYDKDEPCQAIENGLNKNNLGPDAYDARRKERWNDLRKAQETLRLFRAKLRRKTFLAQFGLLAAIFVCGFYLVVVGHFNFRTIYDIYANDPTTGIPCWQFLRMRYMASMKLQNESGNKTKQDKNKKNAEVIL